MSRPYPENDGSVIAKVILSTKNKKYKLCVIIRKAMMNKHHSNVIGQYHCRLILSSAKIVVDKNCTK